MILAFSEISTQDLGRVGGKGLNLGALCRAGFPVPPGFCVTTDGFRRFAAGCPELPACLDALDALAPDDVSGARRLGERTRAALLLAPIPEEEAAAVVLAWRRLGAEHAYAVRSSATAEDLPGASFAGQQDTYLNVRGEAALLGAVRRCWASLFTDRAILYRARGGFGHRGVALSVVVQRMVFPEAAGILFTADPVSGHRGTMSIDAGFGLGEALVSGLVTADLYRVDRRTGALRELRVGDKALAVRPLPGGGTEQVPLSEAQRRARVLSDEQVRQLVDLGASVEAHYGGQPQDIEWCIEGGRLSLVQARPITSLYPLPEPAPDDGAVHVYFSFSHGQNMTDPITPMGREILQVVMPFGKSRLDEIPAQSRTMVAAGGRLYVDVTAALRVRRLRRLIHRLLQTVYPDLARGIDGFADRPEVRAAAPPSGAALRMFLRLGLRVPGRLLYRLLLARPEDAVPWTEAFVERQVAGFRVRVLRAPAGAARLREARAALAGLFSHLIELPPIIGAGLIALGMLRARFRGTAHEADLDALQRGLVGNITTEMDQQVGDLADVARAHPALAAALRAGQPWAQAGKERLQALREVDGGPAFLEALAGFLRRFGMRCQGEIDIGRPRWQDEPGMVLMSVLGNLSRPEAGAHRAHHERLRREAEEAGQRLVAAAGGPFARRKAARLVRLVRGGLAMREHPKYLIIRCLGLLREEIREAAAGLVAAGRLQAVDDVWFLGFEELLGLLAGEGMAGEEVRGRIAARRQEHARQRHLTPPPVMTSEGEAPLPERPKDLPAGALAGLGASAGVVEGVARVVLDPGVEVLHAGEILVAPYTDPGWTPLFVHAAGLVCDVGGMMTHGSVVAREYGIPAVVGVGEGTRRLRTGQRVRVDGSRGIVEVLEEAAS